MPLLTLDQMLALDAKLVQGRYKRKYPDDPFDPGTMYYRGKGIYIRILNWRDPPGFQLHIAEGSTFDRWANSTNFTSANPDTVLASCWTAREIIRMRTYDFNEGFLTIDLDALAAMKEA